MKLAYSYVRFSSPQQMSGKSLARQVEETEKWCARNDAALADLRLQDLGVSAFKSKNRDTGALGYFLEACTSGRVASGSYLVIEALDRLSRDKLGIAYHTFTGILNAGINIVTLDPERIYTADSINDLGAIVEALAVLYRGFNESNRKSNLAKFNWKEKRKNLEFKKLTGTCPSWLKPVYLPRLPGDKKSFAVFDLIPEKVNIVRDIFRLTLDGEGIVSIARKFNASGVAPIGYKKTSKTWHPSFIYKILTNKAVFGFFQPMKWDDKPQSKPDGELHKRERIPDGEPVPDYYPVIVPEADFIKARQGLEGRAIAHGRNGDNIKNLFTGLLYNVQDGAKMTIVDKGTAGAQLVSSDAARGVTGSKYLAFPYQLVEDGFLEYVKEVKAADLLPRKEKVEGDILADISGKLTVVNAHIKDTVELMAQQGPKALASVLGKLEAQQAELAQALEAAKLKAASSQSEHLGEAQSIIKMLKNAGDNRKELRQRLRAVIRRLVVRMDVKIWHVAADEKKLGAKRHAEVVISFESGVKRGLLLTRSYGYRNRVSDEIELSWKEPVQK